MPIDPAALALLTKIRKKHGAEAIMLGSEAKNIVIPRVTSGSLAIDVALGGGWAGNKWNEVIGNESAGKTAIVLKTIAANQALDPNYTTVWFASEDFNFAYAEMLGVDLDRIIIIEDNTMEVVFQHAIEFLESKAVDCVVIDSLPALVSQREEEGTMEDLQPGQAAFLTGKFFRKSTPSIKRSLMREERVCVGLVVNQWREKIGVQHGDPRTTPGGKGKNFYYYIRAEVARTEWITNTKNKKVGQTVRLKNIKNKTAAPGSEAYVDYYFAGPHAGGYDTLKEILGLGIDLGVIKRAGAYYRFAGEQWQGREALVEAVRDDDELGRRISKEVMATIHGDPIEPEDEPEEEEDRPKAGTRRVARKKATKRG